MAWAVEPAERLMRRLWQTQLRFLTFRRMRSLAIAVGFFLLLVVLWDAFETILLPRRVSRRFQLTRLFYHLSWLPWRALARLRKAGVGRENSLSVHGPLSLLLLLGFWATGLIFGFAVLHWGLGTRVNLPEAL